MMSLRALSLLRPHSAAVALSSAFLLTACPPPSTNGDGGPTADGGGDGGQNSNDPCPAGNGGGSSVCHVQNAASPGYKAEDASVDLRGVVAVTDVFDLNSAGTIKGLYVADLPLATWGGVLVTFNADAGVVVSEGQIVDVTGTVQEFSDGAPGSETRVRATSVTATGETADVAPLSVSDPSTLMDEVAGERYEGVLVQVQTVEVEDASLGFGQFEVTGGLITDDTIFRYTPVEGEVMASLTGVMGYNAFTDGGFRLLPRKAADVVSTTKPTVSIPQLRDPSAEGYVAPCGQQDNSCPPVQLNNLVVVSETWFISNSQSSGPLYGFFVADPTAVDGEGRLLPYSGIQVTISPERDDVTTTYSFEQDAEFNWVNDEAAPRPGDVVNLNGQSASFFDMAQIRYTSSLEKVGTVDTVDGVDMPQPARFDGSITDETDPRHPARLRGGRPAVTEAQGGTTRPAEEPDAAVESWEGVLVELVNVETEEPCIAYPYSSTENDVPPYMRDFGYWTVTGGAEIGTLFDDTFGGFWKNVPFDSTDRTCENVANKCQDSRVDGQSFTSLTGIVNYNFNVYRVNPRGVADIQPPSLFVAEGTGNCAEL